jgi:hypothetical protein
MKIRNLLCVAISLLVFTARASDGTKTAKVAHPKLTYWEYTRINGHVDPRHSPEADRLRHDGWIYVGQYLSGSSQFEGQYLPGNFPTGDYPDHITMGLQAGNGQVANAVGPVHAPPAVLVAVFKRPYKVAALSSH